MLSQSEIIVFDMQNYLFAHASLQTFPVIFKYLYVNLKNKVLIEENKAEINGYLDEFDSSKNTHPCTNKIFIQ